MMMSSKAVVVCEHVLADPKCVKCAFRTEAAEPSDSGWQFLCGAKNHTSEEAKVILEDEIKQLIPSVLSIWDTTSPCMFVFDGAGWVRQ